MNQEKTKVKNAPQAKEEAKKQEQKVETKPEAKKAEPEKSEKEQPSAEDKLKQELEETRRQLKESQDAAAKQKDVLMRTAAEYDNFRKRTAREKGTIYADATADTVNEMLSVEDNLERALAQKECSAEDLSKGVEMTQKQMQSALKKLGVTEMGKEGDPFDPALYSAVSHVEDKSLGENVIAKVLQKGYKIGNKVVRHAMVQVAN